MYRIRHDAPPLQKVDAFDVAIHYEQDFAAGELPAGRYFNVDKNKVKPLSARVRGIVTALRHPWVDAITPLYPLISWLNPTEPYPSLRAKILPFSRALLEEEVRRLTRSERQGNVVVLERPTLSVTEVERLSERIDGDVPFRVTYDISANGVLWDVIFSQPYGYLLKKKP